MTAVKCAAMVSHQNAPWSLTGPRHHITGQFQFQQFPSKVEEGIATNQILAWLKTGVIDLKDYISDSQTDNILDVFKA